MSRTPRFSVIIPTRDRPRALTACLESLAALRYPAGAWDLIVADDGGRRSLAGIPERPLGDVPVRVLRLPHRGPAAARNAGARNAAGDYLAFTDDDCRVAPDWLAEFARGFAETGADALGGGTLLPEPARSGMRASQFVVDYLASHLRDAAGNPRLLVSNNAAYRRSVFEALGGFEERFPLAAAEDLELGRRLASRGHRQRSWPTARVWHCHDLSAWGHVRQQFRYGRGGYHLLRLGRRDGQAAGERRDGQGFYRGLAIALWRSSLPWETRALVAAAQVAYRAGVLYEHLRTRR